MVKATFKQYLAAKKSDQAVWTADFLKYPGKAGEKARSLADYLKESKLTVWPEELVILEEVLQTHTGARRRFEVVIQIEIWERGAGYTLASGSSSTAAAAVAHKLGLCDRQIVVHMPGGNLHISLSESFNATMTGPVVRISEGVMDPQMFEEQKSSSEEMQIAS